MYFKSLIKKSACHIISNRVRYNLDVSCGRGLVAQVTKIAPPSGVVDEAMARWGAAALSVLGQAVEAEAIAASTLHLVATVCLHDRHRTACAHLDVRRSTLKKRRTGLLFSGQTRRVRIH